MSKFERYDHHLETWVRSDLKGLHRDHCLCYSCELFKPNTKDNCAYAQKLYEFDIETGMTTPVWECPYFIEE